MEDDVVNTRELVNYIIDNLPNVKITYQLLDRIIKMYVNKKYELLEKGFVVKEGPTKVMYGNRKYSINGEEKSVIKLYSSFDPDYKNKVLSNLKINR